MQHVPCPLRATPLRKLVAPGGRELRTAQRFGFIGREQFRDRSVRPCQAALRRFEERSSLAGWTQSNPETPSTMTLRTSARVLPTSAILFGCALRLAFREPAAARGDVAPTSAGDSVSSPQAMLRIHSAPARVLPEPRPPRSIHTRQGTSADASKVVIPGEPSCETRDPGLTSASALAALGPGAPLRFGRDDILWGGASWSSLAQSSQSWAMNSSSVRLSSFRTSLRRPLAIEALKTFRNFAA